MKEKGAQTHQERHQEQAARRQNRPGIPKNRSSAFALTLALGVGLGTASAFSAPTIIYHDDFTNGSPSSPVVLGGQKPSPIDTNNATWSLTGQVGIGGLASITEDGTQAVINSTLSGSTVGTGAYLPVNPAGGGALAYLPPATYSLSATLVPVGNSNDSDWIALGFGNSAGTYVVDYADSEAWLLYREDGRIESFYGGGDTTWHTFGPNTPGEADTFTITINTNTGDVAFRDTGGLVDWTVPGALTTSDLGKVNSIFIGSYSTGSGKVRNLVFATATPEPASLALLALGGLALIRSRRRIA